MDIITVGDNWIRLNEKLPSNMANKVDDCENKSSSYLFCLLIVFERLLLSEEK